MNENIVDRIIGVYELIVYESGRIKTIQKPLDVIFEPLDFDISVFNPSSRIGQSISVIEKTKDIMLQKNFNVQDIDVEKINKLISRACFEVSKKQHNNPVNCG